MKQNEKNVVCKFGGTSLSCGENIARAAEIVRKDNKRFVVVSAPGKRDKNDEKITDLLIESFDFSKKKKGWNLAFEKVKKRFEEIRLDLKIEMDLSEIFDDLKEEILQQKNFDLVVSRGEFILAKLFAKLINYEFLDAKNFIVLDEKKQVNLQQSEWKFKRFLSSEKNYVIPGFYGADEGGKILTFPRGGSDISGAIVAYLANAKVYENYTDVDGFFSAPPEVVSAAKLRRNLTYDELRLLSFFGAKVLHPDCVQFLKKHNVTLNLKNTFNLSCAGSKICAEREDFSKKIAGLSGKKNLAILTAEKFDISKDFDCLKNLSDWLENFKLPIFLVDISPDKIRLVFEKNSQIMQKNFLKNLAKKFPFLKLSLSSNICVIAIVGQALKDFFDVRKKVLKEVISLNEKTENFACHTGEIFVWFCAEEKNFENLMNCLHEKLA